MVITHIPLLKSEIEVLLNELESSSSVTNANATNEATYSCQHCSKKFKSRQGRHRHMKICSRSKNEASVSDIQKELETQREEIKLLKSQLANTTTNINNGTINNNQNIMIVGIISYPINCNLI